MTPLRTLLRDSTAASHRSLDDLLGRYDLNTDASYGEFLLIQARAVLSLEQALEAADIATILPDWPARARRTAILQDLADLGLAPPLGGQIVLPDSSIAALLGMVYVLEGSRLGARYLIRQREAASAKAFLSHGDGAALWPRFLEVLESSEAVSRHPDQAVAGAEFAFSVFLKSAQAARPPQA